MTPWSALKDIWPTLGMGYTKPEKNASYTKKGPGRKHSQGHKKQSIPHKHTV